MNTIIQKYFIYGQQKKWGFPTSPNVRIDLHAMASEPNFIISSSIIFLLVALQTLLVLLQP